MQNSALVTGWNFWLVPTTKAAGVRTTFLYLFKALTGLSLKRQLLIGSSAASESSVVCCSDGIKSLEMERGMSPWSILRQKGSDGKHSKEIKLFSAELCGVFGRTTGFLRKLSESLLMHNTQSYRCRAGERTWYTPATGNYLLAHGSCWRPLWAYKCWISWTDVWGSHTWFDTCSHFASSYE